MPEHTTQPSLRSFVRSPRENKSLQPMASWVSQVIDAKADPGCLSFLALRGMDTDPIVYLAERSITALIRKPDLFHVKHPLGNKALVAEAEEWLWPLMLNGPILSILARSFIYGAIPYVLDLGNDEFVVRVPPAQGETNSTTRTIPGYWRYVDAHELRPDRVTFDADASNRLTRLVDVTTGLAYDAGRSRIAIWDRQFGEWAGQGARRRAWKPYAKGTIFDMLQAKYLERTVHTPLLIRAPGKDVGPTGEDDMSVGDFIAAQMETLMGGGYLPLPNDGWKDGRYEYEVVPLELPERSEVFERALNRFDSQVFAAYCVPPAMAQIDDAIGGGAARVLQQLFSTFVEGLACHAAHELSGLVAIVHGLNYDTKKVLAPEVGANEIPDKVQKLYLDVLAKIGDAAQLGERVDVDQLLDYMGVPRKDGAPKEPMPAGSGGPGAGRPREPMGKREERREDAATPEGQEDTGAPRDEDGAPIDNKAASGPAAPASTEGQEQEAAVAGDRQDAIIRAFHLDRGVVSVNEVRERLGLGPTEGGEVTVVEFLRRLDARLPPPQAGAPRAEAAEESV